MRLATVLLACLVLSGCAEPQSDGSSPGALWALQRFEQERAVFRMTEAERAAVAHTFERSVADATLDGERTRLEGSLLDCPGASREAFSLSLFDRVRDGARVQAVDDEGRLGTLARLSLADWYLRRARSVGQSSYCDTARGALAGSLQSVPRSPDIDRLMHDSATVARDPAHPGAVLEPASSVEALSAYAMGWTDAVRVDRPQAAYLAAVYGGTLADPRQPDLQDNTPEGIVDLYAAAYPDYEPDALYVLLTNARP